uniref:Uncharacterized protein n=1 Tax=viral metagenome TaxID=1070528 RepID=A0A6C0CB66_9ZZZZ
MSGSHLVLLFLKEHLPQEIALIITILYDVFRSKIKTGHFVFDSPCGHLLRIENGGMWDVLECACGHDIDFDKYKTKEFFYPISNEACIIIKKFYEKKLQKYCNEPARYLEEATNEMAIDCVSCEKCNRRWNCTLDKTNLKPKIVCFCEKFVDQFPCESCHVKMCCVPDCDNFVHKSFVVCKEHYKCESCRTRYYYDHDIPHDNVDGFISMFCPNAYCRYFLNKECYNFSWESLEQILPDDFEYYMNAGHINCTYQYMQLKIEILKISDSYQQ